MSGKFTWFRRGLDELQTFLPQSLLFLSAEVGKGDVFPFVEAG